MCDRVRSGAPIDLMSLICELAYPSNDPIFDCLANNLANHHLSKTTKKPADLEPLLAKYPHLAYKMAKIERRIKDSRDGDKRKGGKSQDGSGTREGNRARDGEKKRT
jgi:hypothetical protein